MIQSKTQLHSLQDMRKIPTFILEIASNQNNGQVNDANLQINKIKLLTEITIPV